MLILLMISTLVPKAQSCLLYEVPMAERLQQATVMVEASVVESMSFADADQTRIYTAHRLQVHTYYAGNPAQTELVIVTQGGQVGGLIQIAEPELELQVGDHGLFLLEPVSVPAMPYALPAYREVAVRQGFIAYQEDGSASDAFHTYLQPAQSLLPLVVQAAGSTPVVISPLPVPAGTTFRSGMVPSISSFSPDTISAGTFSTFTINGSGFGTNTGAAKVEFRNANDGGTSFVSVPASQVVSWTNTQIRVLVPISAGTGTFRITDAAGVQTSSATAVKIKYNLANLTPDNGVTWYRPYLKNLNTTGGMTLQFNVNFAGFGQAVDAFKTALQTWRCNSFIHFDISNNLTSVACNANDGVNVINWDTACALPQGLLGRSTSTYSACAAPLTLFLVDTDIIFKRTLSFGSWYFGTGTPGGAQFDFQSTALHELGHSVQLGHVIAPGEAMHFALGAGTTARVLRPFDVEAATDVLTLSTQTTCGPAAMQPLNSTNCQLNQPVADFFGVPVSGCAPMQVFFFDQSTGGPTSWAWDVDGNGTTDYVTQNPIHTYTQPGRYTVSLTIQNAAGIDSVVKKDYITVYTPPVANAGVNYSICPGDTIELGGNPAATGGDGNYTYNWVPLVALENQFVPNPGAFPSTTTTYTLVVTDGNGCTSRDSATVTVNTPPVVDAGADRSICAGGKQVLGGQPTATGTGTITYQWEPRNLVDDPTAANPIAVLQATTTFTVSVTDQTGCEVQDQVTITVQPAPVVDAGTASTLCAGSTDTLGGNPSASGGAGGYTYLWFPPTGLSNIAVPNPVVNTGKTTTYTLQVFDAIGCVGEDTVTVTVTPLPKALAGADQTVCAGTGVVIGGNPTASGGTAPLQVLWTPFAGLDNVTAQNPTATPTATTTYTVTVSDRNGCEATDNVVVTVNPAPTANAGSDKALCGGLGTSVAIGGNPAGSGGTGTLTYSWSPSSALSNPAAPNPTASPGATTTYILTVTDTRNCADKDTVIVAVNPPLVARAGDDVTICAGECVNIGDSPSAIGGDGNYQYVWSPATGLSSPTAANPQACPVSATTYDLVVTDGKGCSSADAITIQVLPAPVVQIDQLDTAYCLEGAAVTLSGIPVGGTFSGAGVSGNTFNPGVAGLGAHTIAYTYSDANGCTATDSLPVTVYPNPAKPVIFVRNDTLYATSGFDSYQWLFQGVSIANATDSFLYRPAGQIVGDYEVIVTNEFGCPARSDVFTYTSVSPLDAIGAQVEVFPNPAGSEVQIRITTQESMRLQLSILDITGRIVQEPVVVTVAGSLLVTRPLQGLASGTYLIQLRHDNGVYYHQLVKQ